MSTTTIYTTVGQTQWTQDTNCHTVHMIGIGGGGGGGSGRRGTNAEIRGGGSGGGGGGFTQRYVAALMLPECYCRCRTWWRWMSVPSS